VSHRTVSAGDVRAIAERLSLGVGSAVVFQAVNAVQAIVLVPLFLRAWGAEGYGQWLALTALISYLAFADLGGQNYIANLLAVAYARGDRERFQRTLSEAISFFLTIGVVSFVALALIVALFTTMRVPVFERSIDRAEAEVLLVLGGRVLLLSMPGGVYATVYRATGLYARGSIVGTAGVILNVCVSAALLYGRSSPATLAWSMFVVGSILTIAIVVDSRRRVPECRALRLGLAHARAGRNYLRGAIHFWLLALAQSFAQHGVLVILAATASPGVVAAYATHRTLVSVAGYVGALIQGPVLPELSYFWAERRFNELAVAAAAAVRTVVILTGAAALTVWIAAPTFYPVWTRHQLEIEPAVLAVLLLQSVLAAGWSTASWPLLASNQHRAVSYSAIATAAMMTVFAVTSVARYGALAVAAAGLAADLLCGFVFIPVRAAGFLQIPSRVIYIEMLRGFAFALFAGTATFATKRFIPISGLFYVPVVASICWIAWQLRSGIRSLADAPARTL
jgi:O-antigen/teichoic acid export membrane protein